jgi:hypothetical protein
MLVTHSCAPSSPSLASAPESMLPASPSLPSSLISPLAGPFAASAPPPGAPSAAETCRAGRHVGYWRVIRLSDGAPTLVPGHRDTAENNGSHGRPKRNWCCARYMSLRLTPLPVFVPALIDDRLRCLTFPHIRNHRAAVRCTSGQVWRQLTRPAHASACLHVHARRCSHGRSSTGAHLLSQLRQPRLQREQALRRSGARALGGIAAAVRTVPALWAVASGRRGRRILQRRASSARQVLHLIAAGKGLKDVRENWNLHARQCSNKPRAEHGSPYGLALCRARAARLHERGQAGGGLLQPRVDHGRVAHAQRVVQLEVDKLQQRGVEVQEGEHHAVVHVARQHLRTCAGP